MAIRARSIDRASKAASTAFDCDSQRFIFQLLKRQLGNIELLKQVAKNVDFKFAPQVTHAKHKMLQNRTLTYFVPIEVIEDDARGRAERGFTRPQIDPRYHGATLELERTKI